MWNFLISINKKLVYAIPSMMVVGFVIGMNSEPEHLRKLKYFLLPLTFTMVYPMMINLNINHLLDGIKNFSLQCTTQAINFILIPMSAYFLGLVFFAERPYMALGIMLAALIPTSGMTISWTGFSKGNIGAAVNMTVIGLTLGALLTPFYVRVLLGSRVEVDMILIAKQISLIVFLPMALGFVTRQILLKTIGGKQFEEIWSPRFPSISSLGVLGIVFVALALKSRDIAADPAMVGKILVPILIFYSVNYSATSIIGRIFFKRGDSIAMVNATVMRNLTMALAIAINAFGDAGADAALTIAVSYIIQTPSAAWFVRFTDTIFGPPEIS